MYTLRFCTPTIPVRTNGGGTGGSILSHVPGAGIRGSAGFTILTGEHAGFSLLAPVRIVGSGVG